MLEIHTRGVVLEPMRSPTIHSWKRQNKREVKRENMSGRSQDFFTTGLRNWYDLLFDMTCIELTRLSFNSV